MSLPNTINFGEIHLNESRQVLFSITNHHEKDSVSFEWSEHPQCTFSPRIGHLHPGKDFFLHLFSFLLLFCRVNNRLILLQVVRKIFS